MQNEMRTIYTLLTCLIFSFSLLPCVGAQSTFNAVVPLEATVNPTDHNITLRWTPDTASNQTFIYRRTSYSAGWGNVVTEITGQTNEWTDTAVLPNNHYEYRLYKVADAFEGWGYITSGYNMSPVVKRGIIIVVMPEDLLPQLEEWNTMLKPDLEGDGWGVRLVTVSSGETPIQVKAKIVAVYQENPANTKSLLLFGNIPVPYSGNLGPDGHTDHIGAWPADVYYADMNGIWTDTNVNTMTPNDERNHNVPGDGKFDHSILPSDVELEVGRVDFSNMPGAPFDEVTLYKRYIQKNHNYRHGIWKPTKRGIVDDNFGFFEGEAFAASGFKNMAPLVGKDNVIAADYITFLRDSTALWSYGCGGGNYQGAGGIGSSTDIFNNELQGVFTMLFGSYFGDWDSPTNNFLRAPLTSGTVLTNVWSGRPHWTFHPMGMGHTIGFCTKLTQNNMGQYFGNYGDRFVHVALMGDPTLRQDIITPVKNVVAQEDGDKVIIQWQQSDDVSAQEYYIFVKKLEDVEYSLEGITNFGDNDFTLNCLPEAGLYNVMIRTKGLTTTPSGSYYNLSQGVVDTFLYTNPVFIEADAEFTIIGNTVAFTNLTTDVDTFFWDFGDGELSTLENPVHNYLPGNYTVTFIVGNHCNSDTLVFHIQILDTGVKEPSEFSLTISPNPATDILQVKWDASYGLHADLQVFNVQGQEVFTQFQFPMDGIVDCSTWAEGQYFIRVHFGKDHTFFPIIKTKQ